MKSVLLFSVLSIFATGMSSFYTAYADRDFATKIAANNL